MGDVFNYGANMEFFDIGEWKCANSGTVCWRLSECWVSLSYLWTHCCTSMAPTEATEESDDKAERREPKDIHVDGITLRFE